MSDKIVLSDELTKLVDRLLVDAFTAGANGDDFDMLAANRAVAEAAIAADRAARAEPVSWLLMDGNQPVSFWLDVGDAYDLTLTDTQRFVPLYTAPPAAPEK